MIWWNGLGILVPVIFFGVAIISELLTEFTIGQRAMDNPWIISAQFLLTAALIYKVSPIKPPHVEPTGQVPQPGSTAFGPNSADPEHSFFSISMRTWSLVIACTSGLILLTAIFENR